MHLRTHVEGRKAELPDKKLQKFPEKDIHVDYK